MTSTVDLDCVSPLIDLPELVAAASAGQPVAWSRLVERFTPLISAVTRRYRLAPSDASDVRQTVWLRLVEHIEDLREPRALPGWIATTTRNEAQRVISARRRVYLVDPQTESHPRPNRPRRSGRKPLTPGKTSRRSRRSGRTATRTPRPADSAFRRPRVLLPGDQPETRNSHREHRPDPRQEPTKDARHHCYPRTGQLTFRRNGHHVAARTYAVPGLWGPCWSADSCRERLGEVVDRRPGGAAHPDQGGRRRPVQSP